MNAIIALCHFCEYHGPAVVMCTQPYTRSLLYCQRPIPVYEKSTSLEIENYIHANKLYHMHEILTERNSTNIMRPPLCPACTSFGMDDCPFITNDHTSKITYMSSQTAEDLTLSTLLRQACVKSLSFEITPEEEGPVFFGNENRGYSLSYRFKLANAQARGFKSTYSIIFLTRDRLTLFNLWPLLVSNIKGLVTELKENAQQVYTNEQAIENTRSMQFTTLDRHLGASYRNQIDVEPRSLVNVTGEEKVFFQIHAWFTWLLRLAGQTFLSWKPLVNDCGEELSVMENEFDIELEAVKTIQHLNDLYKLLGTSQFSSLAFHTVVGNQIIVRSSSKRLSTLITKAIGMLLPKGCVSRGYSDVAYMQLFRYNLLALHSSVTLPTEVTSIDAAPCVVLLVNLKVPDDPNFNKKSSITSDNVTIRMDSSRPPFAHSLNTSYADLSHPKIIDQYLAFLENPLKLNWRIVLTNFEIVHNEWLNKTQLYFAFKHKQVSLQTLKRIPDSECEENMSLFLKNIGIPTSADHAVVRFWIRGLSDDSKKDMIASIQS